MGKSECIDGGAVLIRGSKSNRAREIPQEVPLIKKMIEAFALEAQINRLLQSRERLRSRQTRITSIWHSDVVRGGKGSDFAEIQADIEEQEAALREFKKQYNTAIFEIDTHPDADLLNNDEFHTLKYIYAYGFTLEKAAAEMHVSQTSAWRYKAAALKKLQNGCLKDG